MATCIITAAPITESNDSRAHVIPSALGGRLKPYGILSIIGNQFLNDKVDLPLVKAFQPFMTLLDGSRDRGQNAPIRVTDDSGEVFNMSFGNELSSTRPKFSMDEKENGEIQVQIEARSINELRTMLGQVKKKLPELDIEQFLQQAKPAQRIPVGAVTVQVKVGSEVTFPAAFVAASIFAAYNSFDVHSELQSYIQKLDQNAVPVKMPPDTFYFYPPKEAIEFACDVGHFIAFIADPNRSKALCLINYFNIHSIGVVLPYSGSHSVSYSYAINVITGDQFSPLIDDGLIRSMKWEATHTLGESSVLEETRVRIGKLMSLVTLRVFEADLRRLLEKALGPFDGRVLTQDDFNRINHELFQYLMLREMHSKS